MKNKFFIIAIIFYFSSCSQDNSKVTDLEAKNDSLLRIINEKDASLNEFIEALEVVQINLEIIKEKESIIKMNNYDGENDATKSESVSNDMKLIFDLMEDNKATIAELEDQIRNNKAKFSKFEKVVIGLNRQISQKNTEINDLKKILNQKDADISDLNENIEVLKSNVDSLYSIQKEKSEVIVKQAEELNKAFYAYGTAKELKKQAIVNSRFYVLAKLKREFKTDYFTQVDITKTKTIPLFCKKVKFLSKHPEGSYSFAKTKKVFDSLLIDDPNKFWASSKYLVLLVAQ